MIDGVNLITTETICISGSFLSNLIPAIIAALGCIFTIIGLRKKKHGEHFSIIYLWVFF